MMRRVAVAALVWSVACVVHSGEPSTTKQCVTIDISKGGAELVLLAVQVAGRCILCIFDTGCNYHAFDKPLADILGSPLKSTIMNRGTANEVPIRFHAPPVASIGGCELRGALPVTTFDMSKVQTSVGDDVVGIIGVEFCRDRIVQLDFDQGVMNVYPRQDDNGDWGAACTLSERDNGRFWLDGVEIGPFRESFLVDTGVVGFGASVTGDVFDRLATSGALMETSTSISFTVEGEKRGRAGILKRLTLGGCDVSNVLIVESDVGRIGMGVLSRFKVTFDLTGSRLFLAKGREFDRVDLPDMSGLGILNVDGKLVVDSLDNDSPAVAAGVQRGDVIMVVNGKPAHTLRITDVRRLLRSKDGQRINLMVSRSRQELPIEFQLKYGFWETRPKPQQQTDK